MLPDMVTVIILYVVKTVNKLYTVTVTIYGNTKGICYHAVIATYIGVVGRFLWGVPCPIALQGCPIDEKLEGGKNGIFLPVK